MIAKVQYNDFVGTAAADISDFYNNSLQYYMETEFDNFDKDRFYCVGCTLWFSDSGEEVKVNFVCFDKEENKHVSMRPNKDLTIKQVISLFKRFSIVMGQDINEVELNEADTIELVKK